MQLSRLLLSLAVLSPLAGCTDAAEDSTPLLFGLTNADVQQLHDAYVPAEPIAMTRARLAAPFDCARYDDLCGQVGADAALAITERQVELARSGAAIVEIERTLTNGTEAAQRDPDVARNRRVTGLWGFHVIDGFQLKVRNGITTPVFGMRRGWTEAVTERTSGANVAATRICVNTGTNSQTLHIEHGSVEEDILLESFNPPAICEVSTSSLTSTTYHERNVGDDDTSFVIRTDGSATASLNGNAFSKDALHVTYEY